MIKDLWIVKIVLAFVLLFILYVLIPHSLFVQVESRQWSDMRVGEVKQTVTIERNVLFTMPGVSTAQLIYFTDDNLRIETDIHRENEPVHFTYERGYSAQRINITWDKSVEKVGKYCVQLNTTIYPLPFLPITETVLENDNCFYVYD